MKHVFKIVSSLLIQSMIVRWFLTYCGFAISDGNEDKSLILVLLNFEFCCSFQVKKKQFFKNFSIILLFGVFGTIISFCLVSAGKISNLSIAMSIQF